jgi:NADH-quinone oxidoreductase subunit N
MNELILGTLPIAGMGLAACLLFLLAAVLRSGRTLGLLGLTATLLLGGVPVVLLWREGGKVVPGALLSSDRLALFFDGLFVLVCALVMLLCQDYFEKKRAHHVELYGFLALATAGMMALASATSFITFYLGLETMSISFYVLAGFLRQHENSVEASLKYFLLGAFSSAFLLFGMAFLYGSSGSLDFGGVAAALGSGLFNLGQPALLLGFFLFLVGLFFKLSLIPFHFWAPDVYQGAPTPVTALMAVGGKTAAAGAAIRVFLSAFTASGLLAQKWMLLFVTIGLITIFVGSMIAITQRHIKRLLAYSSIVHAGFIALGIGSLAVGSLRATMLPAVLFYLAAYLFMNVGAFSVAAVVEQPENHDESLRSYSGLGTSSPYLAALFSVFLLSLAGIPLTVGFLGKFYVFGALVKGGFYWTAALGLVGAVIATYYYLKVVVALYFPPAGDDPAPAPALKPSSILVLTLMGAVTLYLGLFPGILNGIVTGLAIG